MCVVFLFASQMYMCVIFDICTQPHSYHSYSLAELHAIFFRLCSYLCVRKCVLWVCVGFGFLTAAVILHTIIWPWIFHRFVSVWMLVFAPLWPIYIVFGVPRRTHFYKYTRAHTITYKLFHFISLFLFQILRSTFRTLTIWHEWLTLMIFLYLNFSIKLDIYSIPRF